MAECEIYGPMNLMDPFALNFLNGTVDLRTKRDAGEHRRSDLHYQKLVRYSYTPGGGGVPTMACVSRRRCWVQAPTQIRNPRSTALAAHCGNLPVDRR